MAVAECTGEGWLLSSLAPVGATASLLDRLVPDAGRLLVGFDFPIGLPAAYGQRTGFADFRAALAAFGTEAWSEWFEVANDPGDISLRRPFYPRATGGARRDHLIEALAVGSFDQLLRACDRRSERRNAACALFWTLGPSQVGKAAISGWQEVIQPALARTDVGLWPFDGQLETLLQRKRVVIAECYPAEASAIVGLPRRPPRSKRRQADRRGLAKSIRRWMEANGVTAAPALARQIADGFGDDANGEDRFDAVVGLLGMIGTVGDPSAASAPADGAVRRWEGWIFGQPR
jgi:hypothetical protein